MPLVRARLQHRVRNKATALAVFGGIAVGDNAVFLNRIGRNARSSAALVVFGDLPATSLALLIVICTLNQVTARSLTRAVDGGTAVVEALVILWDRPGNQVYERIL